MTVSLEQCHIGNNISLEQCSNARNLGKHSKNKERALSNHTSLHTCNITRKTNTLVYKLLLLFTTLFSLIFISKDCFLKYLREN